MLAIERRGRALVARLACAPVAREARKAMAIVNAAMSIITTKSPCIVRPSMTLPQITQPMAIRAATTGTRKGHTTVADLRPGRNADVAFGLGTAGA